MSANDRICCRQLSTDSPIRSPFAKILSLGFYDGTTSGVAQCSRCLESYRYELVTWDSGQDTRIYSVAPLPQESFEAIVRLVSVVEKPIWPLWLPTLPSGDQSLLVTDIDLELAKAKEPTHVIASLKLEDEILAGKEIAKLERDRLPKGQTYPGIEHWDFWRTYLNLDVPRLH